jgi:hypothetical protein
MSHNSAAQLLSNTVFWNSKNMAFPFEVRVLRSETTVNISQELLELQNAKPLGGGKMEIDGVY